MVVSFFLTHLLLEVASIIIFFLHSASIHLQEAKDSIDEEDPRPTSSTWSYISHPVWFLLFSNHNFFSIYGRSLEHLLDDSLEVANLLGVGQLREQVCSCIAFSGNVVHFETFKIVDERLRYLIVLEQYCFLGLLCVGNLSLGKLRVYVAL